jgi:hypothetical protein
MFFFSFQILQTKIMLILCSSNILPMFLDKQNAASIKALIATTEAV